MNAQGKLNVVTGAFGFSGRHIAIRLLGKGEQVRTLTMHPAPESPLARQIETAPLDFSDPDGLVKAMRGARVLYNTYWVRFARGKTNHEQAVENTKVLIRAAQKAGVERIVHVSITNPSSNSPLPYFCGKAELERVIRESSLSYAVLRPAVLFGEGDILINNIAWMLRRFPWFAIPGNGCYGLRPIHVEDLAALAVEQGGSAGNVVLDAIGPEQYTYEELVRQIKNAIGSPSRLVHLPPTVVYQASCVLGRMLGDVVLTKDEITGLMANLLVSDEKPTGKTSLRGWLEENAHRVGTEYASEVKRHYATQA